MQDFFLKVNFIADFWSYHKKYLFFPNRLKNSKLQAIKNQAKTIVILLHYNNINVLIHLEYSDFI